MPTVNRQYGKLISEVKSALYIHLKESMAEMQPKMEKSLFSLASSSDSGVDQARYFELIRDIRALKDTIAIDFIDEIAPYLRPFAETEAEKKELNESHEDKLSLIDQADMEDIVLVNSLGGRVAEHFREEISDLEARLEHLGLQTPDIFTKNALQPSNIFRAYDQALSRNFNLRNKKILFKYFNEHVALNLNKVYGEINKLLIAANILPQIKLHATKPTFRASSNRAQPAPMPFDDGSGQDNSDQAMNQGGYAMTAPLGGAQGSPQGGGGEFGGGGSGMPASRNPDMNGAAGYSEAGTSGGSGGAQTAHADNSATGYQHTTAGLPAGQVGDVVGEYLGGVPLMPSSSDSNSENLDLASGGQFFPVSTGQYYGHQEILDALSNVQKNPIFSHANTANYDGEAIKQAVLTEIAKISGGAVTKSINRIAEKTIDFIELIFDAIIDDDNISDTIKALLLRLQIPVIKASMIDQEFFIYDDHPARVLLDKIALVGISVSGHKDETYIRLEKIINNLVNEFELQESSFQIALDALNAFIEERDSEALTKEEESQHQILREHARNTVLKSLRFATRGKILPETIHALILKRWPTMMYNHYLKQGKENDEWVTIVDTLRAIINSVQPLNNVNDLNHLVDTQKELIKSTQHYLQRTNQSDDDINQVLQHLRDIHKSLIDQTDFEDDTTDEITTNIISDDDEVTSTSSAPEEDEQPKLQLPSTMTPGMWFQVYNGEDKAQRRCKLSVVIIEDQNLVFVNHQGEIIIEKNLGEFLDEVADGKSKMIMGHSIFDHALSTVVGHLQKSR